MRRQTERTKPILTGCTCLRIRKVARRVTQVYDRHLEPFGLTVTQFSLLSYVRSFDGIGIGALADKMATDPTTLTRNLRPLERRKLLVLAPDAQDRRSRRLYLTDSGRESYAAARPAWARAQRSIEQALGNEGASALNASLEHVLDHLAG